jgi:hypothetical protein
MLGHHRFTHISKTRLNKHTFVVNSLVEDSKKYFLEATIKCIPRLCVSHDIWESKNGHWIGFTLFMVDVTQWEMLSFPIGFKRSKGKKAAEVYEQVLETIKRYAIKNRIVLTFFIHNIFSLIFRYNISLNDIYRALSDNTTSAVSASKMIIDKIGSSTQKVYCMMHTIDLAVKHALGICVRKKRKSLMNAMN